MATLNFNAAQVDPAKAFEVMPEGWYNVIIEDSEMKPTKNNNGSYLQIKLKVLDGEFVNRTVIDRLNLDNHNQMAVEIAYRTLSAICHAVGVMQCTDSQQLHGSPLRAKIRVAAPKDGYEASNIVSGYEALAGQGAQPQPTAQQQPVQQPVQQPIQQAQGFQQPAPQQQQVQQAQGFQQQVQQAQGFQQQVQPVDDGAPPAWMGQNGAAQPQQNTGATATPQEPSFDSAPWERSQ